MFAAPGAHEVTVLYLITAAAIAFGWWRLSLHFHPYAPCRKCAGRRGRNAGSTSKVWGRCTRCGGKGERLRWGAKG